MRVSEGAGGLGERDALVSRLHTGTLARPPYNSYSERVATVAL